MTAPEARSIGIDPQRQQQVVAALRGALPEHCLLYRAEDTRPYECDGLTLYKQVPMVVALPENEAQVQQIVRICHAQGVPIVRLDDLLAG